MRVKLALFFIGAFIAAGIYGCTLGWGSDRDSIRVVSSAISILGGSYQRSRSFGFPLHEAASAIFYSFGGLLAVNLASLAATSAGIIAALRSLRAWAPTRHAVVALSLCGSPLLLVNASSAIDFGWDFAAAMALVMLVLTTTHQSRAFLPLYFLLCAALLLLRPDNLLFIAAVTLPLAVPSLDWRQIRPAILSVAAAAAIAALLIYVALNGTGMFAAAVSTTRPWSARLLRAGALGTAAIGPGCALAAALLLRQSPPADRRLLWLRRATALAWLLYLPRFAALPDQADYLILPVELTILLAAATLPWRAAWFCAALVCIPSIVTVSLLRRDVAGALHLDTAAQWGALPQDWAARGFAARLSSPAMASYVAAQLPGPQAPRTLTYDTYMPAYRAAGGHAGPGDLVIGAGDTYRVIRDTPRLGTLATVPRGWYGVIWACDVALGPAIGWRGWEAPASTAIVAMQSAAAPLRCRLADQAKLDKPTPFGPPRTP